MKNSLSVTKLFDVGPLFNHHHVFLLFSGVTGYLCRAYLEQLIQRIPLESEAKAMKVLSVCEKQEMTEAGKYLLISFFLCCVSCLPVQLQGVHRKLRALH